MGVLGNLDQYTKFQSAEAIRDAAQNPGGAAGMGVGFGAGVALGNQMGSAMTAGATAPGTMAGPPPLPTGAAYHVATAGAAAGPFDLGALAPKIRDGSVTRASLVWKSGMPGWVAADTIPELASMFAAAPPPLPKG